MIFDEKLLRCVMGVCSRHTLFWERKVETPDLPLVLEIRIELILVPSPLKISPGLPAWSVQKVSKRVRKSQKSVGKCLFDTFLRLFDTPGREAFWRLFEDFGHGGPGDSCKWPFGS